MKDKNKKDLIIIILASLVIVLIVAVILLGINYFKFNSSNVADRISDLDKKKEEAIIEDTNKENIQIDDKNDINESIDSGLVNNSMENIVSPSSDSNNDSVDSTYSSDDVISYFQSEADSLSVYQENESFALKAKNAFTNIVDFIFYDKEIKGYTFNELTNSAKLKVIKIALTIDSKIDKYFPNYKETIKDKYDNLKGKLASLYLEITLSLCETVGSNTCNQAKEDFNNMKESFGFTWELIKELATNGSNKVKNFYESWRNSE